jgi:predicted transcriptional regulator YdeE
MIPLRISIETSAHPLEAGRPLHEIGAEPKSTDPAERRETGHPSISKESMMNLTEKPEFVHWPETHYVFVEKTGPFQKTAPEAWQKAHSVASLLKEHNKITGYMSLYRMSPNTYRAGFALAAAPVKLPADLKYEKFAGGAYCKFVLTGPYSDLPAASGRVWQIASENDIVVRADFAIENYVSDPSVTPAEKLITEILIPTA